MKIQKIFAYILPALLVLGGCGSDDSQSETDTEQAGKVKYVSTNFELFIPQEWEIIEKKDLTSSISQEVSVAFRNNIKSEIFTANMVITETAVESTTNVEDFAKSTTTNIKKGLLNLGEIASTSSNITSGETALPAITIEFEGKKGPGEPNIHFKLFFVVNNGIGYTITTAYLPTEDESVVKMTDEMLNSFTLK